MSLLSLSRGQPWGYLVCPALSSSWSKMEKQWQQPIAHIFLALIPSVLPSLRGGKKDPEPCASAFAPLCPFLPFEHRWPMDTLVC